MHAATVCASCCPIPRVLPHTTRAGATSSALTLTLPLTPTLPLTRCDQLCRAFQRQIGCNAIHGDKEQRERERVLQEFKDGRYTPYHLGIPLTTLLLTQGRQVHPCYSYLTTLLLTRCASRSTSPPLTPYYYYDYYRAPILVATPYNYYTPYTPLTMTIHRAPILVATDVAARGLDIKQIMMVAHCDPNPDPDQLPLQP